MKKYLISLFLIFTGQANAQAGYFNPKDLGQCIASYLHHSGGSRFLSQRRETGALLRKELLENSPETISRTASLWFYIRKISQESALASLPLIDENLLRVTPDDRASIAGILFSKYDQASVYPVDDPNLIANVAKDWMGLKDLPRTQLNDAFMRRLDQTLLLANPIVEWLLHQPKGSVSHAQLLHFATMTFNGDVLTALAVLGELFYNETMYATIRTQQAVLASKMRPLVDMETEYSTGHNYHFWRVITASLYRGGTTLGRAYGYIDNNLESYRFANRLGFDVADEVLRKQDEPNEKCVLTN